jgi:hypothetical protein
MHHSHLQTGNEVMTIRVLICLQTMHVALRYSTNTTGGRNSEAIKEEKTASVDRLKQHGIDINQSQSTRLKPAARIFRRQNTQNAVSLTSPVAVPKCNRVQTPGIRLDPSQREGIPSVVEHYPESTRLSMLSFVFIPSPSHFQSLNDLQEDTHGVRLNTEKVETGRGGYLRTKSL